MSLSARRRTRPHNSRRKLRCTLPITPRPRRFTAHRSTFTRKLHTAHIQTTTTFTRRITALLIRVPIGPVGTPIRRFHSSGRAILAENTTPITTTIMATEITATAAILQEAVAVMAALLQAGAATMVDIPREAAAMAGAEVLRVEVAHTVPAVVPLAEVEVPAAAAAHAVVDGESSATLCPARLAFRLADTSGYLAGNRRVVGERFHRNAQCTH